MKIRKYKNLYQLTLLPRIFPINCYVYEENNSLTIIDTGTSIFYKDLIALSNKINKPITKVLLTHPHSDHIGGLDALKKELPYLEVYISKRDALLMDGDFATFKDEKQNIKGSFKKVLTKPNSLLEDKMEIGSLTAIATPGHTPGSMSFYDTHSRILVVGDALQTKGGLSVAGDTRIFFPFPAFGTWDKETALLSAKKLAQLDIDILATGHGDVLLQPKKKILKAVQRADRKLGGK